MQRLAIITPYATLYFQYEGLEDEADKNIKLRFRRRTDHMPRGCTIGLRSYRARLPGGALSAPRPSDATPDTIMPAGCR